MLMVLHVDEEDGRCGRLGVLMTHFLVFFRVFHISLARRSILGSSPSSCAAANTAHQQLGPRLSPVFSVRFMYFG
jgi:hypothetical protein